MSEAKTQYTAVILVAAGMGTRLGAGMPKALVEVAGKSLAHHALERILQVPGVRQVVVVCPPEDQRLRLSLAGFGDKLGFADGGDSRAASVQAGLRLVAEQATKILVHDAARAFAPVELFAHVLAQLDDPRCEAAIPALSVTDTICVIDETEHGTPTVLDTPARSMLRAVQTPQGFEANTLRRAHRALENLQTAELEAVTDDASVVRRQGTAVWVVPGSAQAVKITHPEDLRTAAKLAQPQKEAEAPMLIPRVGTGIDVHAVSQDPDRQMWLAGLHFPEDIGLSGHSDGDAVAHAACDALFSASGIGDLGTHFGVDRPEFAGASGVSLLAEAARLVREAGFEIGNIAVQFVGRRPRFGARREEANAVLSAAAGAPVSVTATTSDGLGYEGAGQGITAYATALVYRH